MDVIVSAILGTSFLVVGCAAVFLMFHLWGYPFDKATRTSAAPPGLMRLHRVLGWIYVLLYIVMMVEMVCVAEYKKNAPTPDPRRLSGKQVDKRKKIEKILDCLLIHCSPERRGRVSCTSALRR